MAKPNEHIYCYSPDDVAECIDGIPDTLRVKLWDIANSMPYRPDLESEAPDCFVRATDWWDKLTEKEQNLVNDCVANAFKNFG